MSSLQIQLVNKLWIADLHDLDQAARGKKLIWLKTYNESLNINQDVVFAKSYRKRSPMVTIKMSTQGYTPTFKDLMHVMNIRSCFQTEYTILAGSYWENEVENINVVRFFDKFLLNDPTVIEHRKFHNKEQNNNNTDATKATWSWKQSYSNFPFLLFVTEEPIPSLMSLSDRTEIDCLVSWQVIQNNRTIGKALFLPYSIPDMVGEAGIAVFRNPTNNKLMGIFMCERLRDSLLAEDRIKYRETQELTVPDMLMKRRMTGQMFSGGFNGRDLAENIADSAIAAQLLSLLGCDSDGLPDNFDVSDDMSSEEDFDDDSYSEEESESDNELHLMNGRGYMSNNGDYYPPDGQTPKIVDYAVNGYLSLVQRETVDGKADVLNASRKWTEVEEKWGYDKSWDWHDDTPLIAAARNGHLEIVQYLLSVGADPTLESCHTCDVNGTALKAADDCLGSLKKRKDEIFLGKYSYSVEPKDPQVAALDIIYRINTLENIINVLKIAVSYWKRAPYYQSSFSKQRKEKLKNCPNRPTNENELKIKLNEFTPTPVDVSQLQDLVNAVVRMRKEKETGQQPLNSVFQQLSVNNTCAISSRCDGNVPAGGCQHKCCGKCCPGPCQRHKLKNKRLFNDTKANKIDTSPYHPSMKSYGGANIDAFVEQCTEWDETTADELVLPTGEEIRSVTHKKLFSEKHYIKLNLIYVFGVLLSKTSSLVNGNRSSGGSCGNFYEGVKSPTTEKLIRKVSDFQSEQRRITKMQPILEKLFAKGYTYPSVKEDPSLKVLVTGMVSFGDLKDAQNRKPQKKNVGGTITAYVNTVRPFKPGYYYTTVVTPSKDSDPFVMYHHESVDGRKLMDQIILMVEDYEDYHPKVANTISRYDWCEWRNWGGDVNSEEDNGEVVSDGDTDSKRSKDQKWKERWSYRNTTYFCPTESAGLLNNAVKQGKSTRSNVIQELTGYLDNSNKTFALGTNVAKMNSGDWIYGRIFEDKGSGENFALVVNFCMGDLFVERIPEQLKNQYPDKKFTSVTKTNLRFDIAEFEK